MLRGRIYIFSLILCLLLVSCGKSEVVDNAIEYTYNNGICAFNYNEEKLKVSDVMFMNDNYMLGVDIKSDKLELGKSNLIASLMFVAECSESDVIDYLQGYIKDSYRPSEITDEVTSVSSEKGYVIGEYNFTSGEWLYKTKAYSKWGSTFIVVLMLKSSEDEEYVNYLSEVYDSFNYVGKKLDENYAFKVE